METFRQDYPRYSNIEVRKCLVLTEIYRYLVNSKSKINTNNGFKCSLFTF